MYLRKQLKNFLAFMVATKVKLKKNSIINDSCVSELKQVYVIRIRSRDN